MIKQIKLVELKIVYFVIEIENKQIEIEIYQIEVELDFVDLISMIVNEMNLVYD